MRLQVLVVTQMDPLEMIVLLLVLLFLEVVVLVVAAAIPEREMVELVDLVVDQTMEEVVELEAETRQGNLHQIKDTLVVRDLQAHPVMVAAVAVVLVLLVVMAMAPLEEMVEMEKQALSLDHQ